MPRALVTCLAVWLLLGVGAPGRASAQGGPLVTCSGEAASRYTPGLVLLQPRDVYFTGYGDLSTCAVSDGAVSSATYFEGLALQGATCLVNVSPTVATVSWSNGETSTLTVTGVEVNVVGALQVYTSVGLVATGRYQGHVVNVVRTFVALDRLLACLSPQGLTGMSGGATLTVLGL